MRPAKVTTLKWQKVSPTQLSTDGKFAQRLDSRRPAHIRDQRWLKTRSRRRGKKSRQQYNLKRKVKRCLNIHAQSVDALQLFKSKMERLVTLAIPPLPSQLEIPSSSSTSTTAQATPAVQCPQALTATATTKESAALSWAALYWLIVLTAHAIFIYQFFFFPT